MKKIGMLLMICMLFAIEFQGQEQEVDSTKIKGWKKSGLTSLIVNQTAFSNWISGGENSIAATLSVDYNINYYNNGWSWDTKIIGSFGINKNSDSKFFKKIDNRIEINSLIGKKFIEKFSFSSFLNFKTQFAKGFKYSNASEDIEIREEITRFLSPAYLQIGIGVYWKQDNSLWVNIAPITGRLILASRKFTDNLDNGEEYFGIPKGEISRFELGASLSAFYKFEVIENIQLEQRINLYSDYLGKTGNIDVDYTITAFMKINDYLSTNLIIQCLYDDNAIKRVQLREVFGLAINLNLLELPAFK
ncbi:MAG: DUF3078 domain-containing protein [Flavobacteriaceae bacterium]|jgi:hypothetical protein|nr:DUF3078 domain-containing protein [Flavobacteriaceae bacterium]MBT4113436.1 DUF3078 domain-containing protein [Flavobacteriaceae bacterium]MBT4613536.1 DUF3078 domain-containing protein [Flavobacteriaceae bacterium]MBT5246254.1 DUF3078 domain-containing protein [Flavobacteriaceae bacterium]MBT5650460.1 DUF3078 domain-containing protein [Flavobacteriaceae bacterium]